MTPDGSAAVRRIAPADGGGLVRLWRETWTATYGPSLGAAALARMLRGLDAGAGALLPGRDEGGWCAVSDDRIVGSVVVAERGGTAYLWGCYVLPAAQRMGLGARLLAAMAGGLAASGRIEARVLASSAGAQAFYRARGFETVGAEEVELMPGVTAPASVMAANAARLRAVAA